MASRQLGRLACSIAVAEARSRSHEQAFRDAESSGGLDVGVTLPALVVAESKKAARERGEFVALVGGKGAGEAVEVPPPAST